MGMTALHMSTSAKPRSLKAVPTAGLRTMLTVRCTKVVVKSAHANSKQAPGPLIRAVRSSSLDHHLHASYFPSAMVFFWVFFVILHDFFSIMLMHCKLRIANGKRQEASASVMQHSDPKSLDYILFWSRTA